MALDALLARLERRAVTSVTSDPNADGTAKPAPMLACTPVTAVTSEKDVTAREAPSKPFDREAFEERAAIMEFDGGMPREEAELLALLERHSATIH